jgi:hypothetical protein
MISANETGNHVFITFTLYFDNTVNVSNEFSVNNLFYLYISRIFGFHTQIPLITESNTASEQYTPDKFWWVAWRCGLVMSEVTFCAHRLTLLIIFHNHFIILPITISQYATKWRNFVACEVTLLFSSAVLEMKRGQNYRTGGRTDGRTDNAITICHPYGAQKINIFKMKCSSNKSK